MCRVPGIEAVGNMPFRDLVVAQYRFLRPLLARLAEKRLRKVAVLAIRGLLAGHSPRVTRMARGLVRQQRCERPMARGFYRFLWNTRFDHRTLRSAL
ncbi:MAG: hypothetical protein H5T69_04240 [Chloroflexi bacterium]|nr:hypothetical protein [Chloroflexota bacterium]